MSERIMMTPPELEEGASYLRTRLGEMQQQVQALNNKIEEVSSRWEGMSQDAFMERYRSELYPVLYETMPQIIEALSYKLEGAANAIRETDQQIAGAFRG